jgi:hypothetical protein
MSTFFNNDPQKWEVDKPTKLGFIDPSVSKVVTDLITPQRFLIPFTEMSDNEATDYIGQEFELDVECYPNYFLIKMKHRESGRCVVFEQSPWHEIDMRKLSWCLFAFRFVTFNGLHYDMPLVAMCLKGYRYDAMKLASNMIIDDKMKPSDVLDHFNTQVPFIQHIDLKEVAPVDGSLKKYAGRLHAKRMQELPYDPNKELTYEETVDVKHYCGNDLDNTGLLKDGLKEQLKLRQSLSEKYQLNLMSKSDAQIAEAVISKEVGKILNKKVKRPTLPDGYTCQYKDPGFIKFNRPELQEAYQKILNAKFHLDGAGSPVWPAGLGVQEKNKQNKWVWVLKVKIGDTTYKLGMGGIHSNEKSTAFKSDDEYILLDRDVASYYPRIVLNQRLYPKHLTEAFLTVYQWLVDSRLAAKKAGDNVGADSGKIIINGSFGKLGSKYSVLYSPDLMLQVTLSGQLCLLMLIEMLEDAKVSVVSANTDGIVSRVKRSERQKFEAIVKYWEGITNFETEETGYQSLYSKDVNNYIAVKYKEDAATKKLNFGKNWLEEKEVCKLKGAYANPWPDKKAQIFRFHVNPTFQICTEAICAYLMDGTPIAHTIRSCPDITKFISVRAVKGGAHKDRVFVGKFIRWYASTDTVGCIHSVLTGNKVADTIGGKPLMDLPDDLPADIDYNFYEDRARKMMVNIGYYRADELKGQGSFF